MPRIRRAVPFAVALVLAVPLMAQGRTTTSKRAPQDCLPASSYFAAGFAGLDAASQAISSHDAAKLVIAFLGNVPKLARDELDRHLEKAADEIRHALDQAEVPVTSVRAVLHRPMAVGVGRMTIRGMGASVALVVDEGEAAAPIDELVAWVARMGQRHLNVVAGTKQAAGIDCRTLEIAGAPTILLARTGGLFVVTNSEPYLAEIAACARGQQPTLAARSTLGAQRQSLGGTPFAEFYANTGPLLTVLDPVLPYEATELGDALGVRSLGGVYGGVASVGGGTAETFDVALQGSPNGMLKAAFAGTADLAAADWFRDDTIMFATLRFDPTATFAGFEAMMGMLPEATAKQARAGLQRDLGRALRHAGVTPAQLGELLRAAGGSLSIGAWMAPGVPFPEGLAVLTMRDSAAVAPWLDKLVEAATKEGIEWKTRDADGVVIRYFDVPVQGIRVPYAPAFAMVGDRLLFGSQPKVIIEAMKQHQDRDSSLAVAADFAGRAEANKNASLLVHLRHGVGITKVWRMIEAGLRANEGAMQELGFGPEALPDQEEIARALGTTTLSITVDEQGVRLRSQGNLGLGGFLIGGACLFDEVLQRAANKVY